jgi:hypothetical protein
MVWGCISHDCKLDLVTIQGNLTGDQYIRDVLQPVGVPHFDNHPLATRPVYMDDSARPHHSRAAMLLPNDECFAQEVPEHVYDGLTCPKYALWDSNPGSWLAKEQKSRLVNIRYNCHTCVSTSIDLVK